MNPLAVHAPRVACLGPLGSYTALAARQAFGEQAELVPMPAHTIARQVQRGRVRGGCDFGVLAAANIQYGPIENTFASLYATRDIQIVGEIFLTIQFSLLSSTSRLEDIHTVVSHEAALAQCTGRLARLEARLRRALNRQPAASTSAAVQQAMAIPGVAALGSTDAARRTGALVLLDQMQDHRENVTCFWVLGAGGRPPLARRNKTVFLVELSPGVDAMHRLLGLFAGHGVEVTMLKEQVVPSKSRASRWNKAYFIECAGHVTEPGLNAVQRALRRPEWEVLGGRRGRVVGSFPAFPVETLRFERRDSADEPRSGHPTTSATASSFETASS